VFVEEVDEFAFGFVLFAEGGEVAVEVGEGADFLQEFGGAEEEGDGDVVV